MGFPLYTKEGWKVCSQDSFYKLGASNIEKIVPMCDKWLYECDYKTSFFDVVTAWAVFEHLHDPIAYFREVARILKPGGKFIFLVPDFNSIAS